MAEPMPERLEFFFEYDPGYRVVATNGVWGGVTTRGELRLDFFVESVGNPERVTNEISEGKIGRELSRVPERRVVRRLQVGVLLSLEHAESIADFIRDKVAEVRAARESRD